MSGRKRALLRMNERDRKKLKNIESRLGEIDVNFTSFKSKINEIKAEILAQEDSKKYEQDQVLISNIAHLDEKIHEIETATQLALSNQATNLYQIMQESTSTIQDIHDTYDRNSNSLMTYLNQMFFDIDSNINYTQDRLDAIFQKSDREQHLSWQYLSYAEEVFYHLLNQVGDERNHAGSINQIRYLVSTAWMNYQNEFFQAALSIAQQSILEVNSLRIKIEEDKLIRENLLLQALEETSRIHDLALNCQQVRAIDLDGNELHAIVDIDYWTGGLLSVGIQTLESIKDQLINGDPLLDEVLLNELINKTLPAWEQALHDYVSQSRIDVIAAQARYEVAKTVVHALSEQGFELETGSFEEDDMRLPYHVLLGNLEGSQVHISVSPTDENPLNYLLDIDSYDSELRTEAELRYRAKELLGTMESAGLKVGQVYQADDERKLVRDKSQDNYSIHPEIKRFRNNLNS